MGMGYVLGIQPLPQLRAGGRGYLSETVTKTFVQSLITRDRSRRGIILTAKSKEKPDHILRFAILPLVHVDRDPKFDGFLSWRTHCTFSRSLPEALEPLFGLVDC